MAWETRKRGQGSSYYTRSERDASGRVVRTYYGNGESAALIAEIHRMESERREIERSDTRNERRRFNEIDDFITDAYSRIEKAMSAALEAVGYRRHARGQWRKTRQHPEEELMPSNRDKTAQNAIRQEMEVRKFVVPDQMIDRLSVVRKGVADGASAEARAQAIACVRAHPSEIELDVSGFIEPLLDLLDPGDNDVTHLILRQEFEKHLRSHGYAQASSLEKLLIERIVICRMQLAYYERQYTHKMKSSTSLAVSEHDQKRIDMAHRRYLASIKSLAQVRRLKLPAVQVNIGEKQINVAG